MLLVFEIYAQVFSDFNILEPLFGKQLEFFRFFYIHKFVPITNLLIQRLQKFKKKRWLPSLETHLVIV